ncbi:MAG: ligase-associated DNA damage response DEXH box helicase [Flavobacteriales bacterium]|nr:ligase-associated DNA damage response DEXH box helicase [Flavobacteriales bacterium]
MDSKGWKPKRFQREAWKAVEKGRSGLINAPTGSGKTYSLWIPITRYIKDQKQQGRKKGPFALWITPLRSLSKEIAQAAERYISENDLDITVGIRNGDTSQTERRRQKTHPPDMLVITPESVHLLLAQKGADSYFKHLGIMVVDEWHELLGSKRGVQVELARCRLKSISSRLQTWGISATIGNMDEAMDVLMGDDHPEGQLICSNIQKQIEVRSVLPDDIEKMPWGGHLGIKLLDKVIPIIKASESTLIFTNTRAQCEIWYHHLLVAEPELAGQMAMHHGSIAKPIRLWVEEALRQGDAKVVVCTSSLDLGVDFTPVDTVIQIGGPKGVSRFVQRAGRSGHRPEAVSRIHFLPTHALELVESSAIRVAIERGMMEARPPFVLCYDVLIQFLMTLAVSDGFRAEEVFQQVKRTHCYRDLEWDDFLQLLDFIQRGSPSLRNYEEFKKVEYVDGLYKVFSRRVAMRHRMNIGTIVSDAMLHVKFVGGPRIGMVEEWFVSSLKEGDIFWFAGKALRLVRIHGQEIQVRKSKATKGKIPAWMGGKLPMSSQLSLLLRERFSRAAEGEDLDEELKTLAPIIQRQKEVSVIPDAGQLLMEHFETRDGHHLCIYPFEGKFVHEALASLLAYRISLIMPISFTFATNDYGFELLSDSPIPIDAILDNDLFSPIDLSRDLLRSMNSAELTQRSFRDIAVISGLIFNGYPGQQKKERHLQASARLFYQVFEEHEPDNLLLRQAIFETFEHQLEESRLRLTLERFSQQEFKIVHAEGPTPLSFPIIVNRLREKLSSEKLEDRIKKLQIAYQR